MPKSVARPPRHANRKLKPGNARRGGKGKAIDSEQISERTNGPIPEPAFRADFAKDLQRIRRGKFRRSRPPSHFAGIWKDMPEADVEEVKNVIREGRRLDLEKQKRLLKR